MRPRISRYACACVASVVGLALIVALNGFGSFYTDIKPEVYLAPWDTLARYLSGWTASPYLGSANFNVGLVPVLLVVGLLRAVGMNPEWAFKVFHFGLWLSAAWGANRLVRLLAPRASRWAGLVAGIVYLANPYQIQAGVTLAILLPMALLPWLLITFVHAVRHPRSWAWPAAFGLIFFGMSGMNVAVVPLLQLAALIPILLVARFAWRARISDLAVVTAKCAAFVVGVSLYWVVPARAALTTGRQIVMQSETLDGIAKVSSFPEVLRGLGMWPLYGTDSSGPWVPQHAIFLVGTFVVLLTMLWPTLSALALRYLPGDVRGMVVGWIALAAVVMVGMFPGPGREESPFGRVLGEVLQNPAASAFRTTNKVGAVLALGFAVALGLAAEHWARAVQRRGWAAPLIFAMVSVLLTAWALPALTGRLYTSQMNIPGYWHEAARAADKGHPSSRVLFLPGQVRPTYRWTAQRPDDLPNSLLKRDAVLPETSPNASAPGGNYLAAVNDALQSAGTPANAISSYARYLGADRVLVRHDTVWEQDGGARPGLVDRVISVDPGLFGRANFGQPGEFVFGRGTDAYSYGEALMHPVQLYDVRDPVTAVRATSDNRSIVVAGDAWSIGRLAADGLLSTQPSFRYAADLTVGDLLHQLGQRHALVITDTNARRAAIPNRLTNGEGSLLAADETAKNMRALGTPDDQTVAVRSGATVTASARGGTFFDVPSAAPENLLDADPDTSWLFGDFGRAVGQYATVRQPTPTRLGTVKVQQAQLGSARIDRLSVTAGGRTITHRLPDKGYASFDFGDLTTDTVRFTVAGTRGDGYNMVGLSDVKMAGALAIRTARTPLTYQSLHARLTPAQQQAFARTPLDVTLARQQGTASTTDDPEKVFRRIVTLPDERNFTARATVRTKGDVETAYDDVAGYSRSTRATSSDFYFHNADARASMAVDGKSSTAWMPGGGTDGSWWQLTGSRRPVSSVTIDQAEGFGAQNNTDWAGWATVTVDGKKVVDQYKLRQDGRTTIKFPEVDGRTVRVTFKAAIGRRDGPPPRFTTIDTGARMAQDQPGPLDSAGSSGGRCLTVGTVDGQPLRMRPATKSIAGESEQATSWAACAPLSLGAGEHRIEQAAGFVVDSMTLTDRQDRVRVRTTDPVVKITKDAPSSKAMTVAASGPFNVILGQSYDARWKATANGRDLGAPTTLDGYSTGWRVPAGGRYEIEMRFGPQMWSNIAAGASGLVLIVALMSVVLAARRKRLFADDVMPTDVRTNPVPRWSKEAGAVLVAGFAVGWPGLVAAALVVALQRLRPVPPRHLLSVGAGLMFTAVPLYLWVIGDKRGTVSADAVALSLWPHRLAGFGLVVVLLAALSMRGSAAQPERDGAGRNTIPPDANNRSDTAAGTSPATEREGTPA